MKVISDTPGYFQQLGLIEKDINVDGMEVNLNLLFRQALRIVAFMPYAYMLDKYRCKYRGKYWSKQRALDRLLCP